MAGVQSYGGKIITAKDAGLPQDLVYSNWKNFGPRIGFAYRVSDGRKAFVIRGGYRISYYTEPISNWFNSQSAAQLVSANFVNSVSNTAVSPDGLPNYGLRSVPQYVAGVNTPSSIININDTRTLPRGFSAYFLDPHLRDPRVQDWNLTIEKEMADNTVVRATYLGNHTTNILQTRDYNDSTPTYIWYAVQKTPVPTGPFANVATRPYDQQVWGTVNQYGTTGMANFNGAQLEVERRFRRGLAFQAFWVLANTLTETGSVPSSNSFLPGAVPTDFDAANRFLNYRRDTHRSPSDHPLELGGRIALRKGKALPWQRSWRGRQTGRRLADRRHRTVEDELLHPAHQHLPERRSDPTVWISVSGAGLPERRLYSGLSVL